MLDPSTLVTGALFLLLLAAVAALLGSLAARLFLRASDRGELSEPSEQIR